MKFKSYHLRWGIVGIGVAIIIMGSIKGFFEIGLSERLENWIISTLVINAIVLFIYMKKFQAREEEEEGLRKSTPSMSEEPNNNNSGKNRKKGK